MDRVVLLLALALLAPAAAAQVPTTAAAASFLIYHMQGGRDPDPLASPLAPPPEGTQRLPATVFDRATRADAAPENAPERALAHFREFQRLLASAQAKPAQARLTLDGELAPGVLKIHASADRTAEITLIMFEHGPLLAGRPSPYVARFVAAAENGSDVRLSVNLDPAWHPEKLGVVAVAREGDAVLQSATWTVAQDRPTVQSERAVLVEHVTASWCDACGPADDAIALLSTQRGAAGALDAGEVIYYRAPGLRFYAGLAAGALVAALVIRRRDP